MEFQRSAQYAQLLRKPHLYETGTAVRAKTPLSKPVRLLEHIVSIASNENDVVFDPFMGVGSTGVAALRNKRRFIGIEIEKSYFDAAEMRIGVYR